MKYTKEIKKLMKLVSYNELTGLFTFKERKDSPSFNSRFGNKIAGSTTDAGYIVISLKGKAYLAHRLAHAFMTGDFPENGLLIDHKNHMRSDNKWVNLRKCNHSQNACSTFSKGRGRSYFKGVSRCKVTGLWLSRVTKDNKIHFLGRFKSALDAALAYDVAASKHQGEFATINFS
jgi:hypothetical protein